MSSVARLATSKALFYFQTPAGLSDNLAAMSEAAGVSLPEIGLKQYSTEIVAVEVVDRSAGARYPAVHVYCEKLENLQREKFRTFSGKAHLAVEVRVTQDRLEGIGLGLGIYIDAVTRVLDQRRGDWGDGMFYSGGYQAVFGPVRHGGRNYVQTGKVMFTVDVSQE